jgi:hypothetical protein
VPSTKKSLPATQRLAHETHRASRTPETIWSRSSTVRGILADPVDDSLQSAHIDPSERQPIALKVRCRRV